MRRAKIYNHGIYAGDLIETNKQTFEFHYLPDWLELIEISFLSENMKLKYKDLLLHRIDALM
jgi:hypothetical protein